MWPPKSTSRSPARNGEKNQSVKIRLHRFNGSQRLLELAQFEVRPVFTCSVSAIAECAANNRSPSVESVAPEVSWYLTFSAGKRTRIAPEVPMLSAISYVPHPLPRCSRRHRRLRESTERQGAPASVSHNRWRDR